MNETLFILHACLVAGFALGALRLGKEALVAWIAMQAILANLFVIKQVELFGLPVTSSDVFTIGGVWGLNLLQEYFGKDSARKAIIVAFAAMFFFALMAQIHLLYLPSAFDGTQGSFSTILSANPRIMAASFTAFYIVQRWDVWFYGQLKARCAHWPMSVRNGLSLLIAQLFDTLLFSFLGLYGIVTSLTTIIIFSYCIKVLVIASTLPFTQLSRRIAKEPAS